MNTHEDGNKYMSFWMMVALVSGNMVGSGIFLLPSGLAAIGSVSILAWIFTSVGALLLAVIFSNMSKLIPNIDGGPYTYVRKGLGNFMGFQSGFGYWLSLWIGNCAIAIAMVGYLQFFFPFLDNKYACAITAIAIIWILTLFNLLGPRKVGWLQLLSMIAKATPLILLMLAGWWYIHPENFMEFNRTSNSSFSAFGTAASLTLWAFIGLESAAVAATKVKNPEKTVPLATMVGTLIAAAIYIGTSIVIMGMLPAQLLEKSTAPFALAAAQIIGHSGGVVIAITAVIACLGTLNGWIMLTSVVAKSIAETKLFPSFFAKENRYGAAHYSLIFSGILMTILLLFTISPDLVKQFNLIILMAVLAALIPYFYTTMSNILVTRSSDLEKTRKIIIISIMAWIYSLWTIIGSGPDVVYYGMILLFAGSAIYIMAEWGNIHKESKIK